MQTTNNNLFNSVLEKVPGYKPGDALTHILLIVALAVIVHFLVRLVHFVGDWLIRRRAAKKSAMLGFVTQQPKFVTLTGLISSALTFLIYFFAMGFILNEFKVNLTAYLATASVIGLAVAFGSQGLVQDVVSGLTLIFSDTLDVGDMIEVSGQIGRIEHVGLRFTKLINFYNQDVFIPNRTIANVSRFPLGGVYAYADIRVPAVADPKRVVEVIRAAARGMWKEFGAIILTEPEIGSVETPTDSGHGWSFLRVRFKIWPGQGSLIETTFRQQVIQDLKTFDAAYADWMVTVTYRALVGSPEGPAPL